MSTTLKNRICLECGSTFLGGPRAWYCPTCRKERMAYQAKMHKIKKRNGDVVPLGSVIQCLDCGTDFIKQGGNHCRCAECAARHLKEVDNAQSREWKKQNIEKCLKAKRDFSKKRNKEEGKKSGISGIVWKKDSGRWRVRYYNRQTKKQIHVGYAKELEDAKRLLENYKNMV